VESEVADLRRRTLISLPLAAFAGCARRRTLSAPVRVLAGPYFYLGGLYLSQELGYFKDQGLEVELQQVEGSRAMVPLLADGKADVAFTAVNPSVINAIARGLRLRIAAGRGVYTSRCPDARRVCGSRQAFPNGFTDLRQMKGKHVAPGSATGIGAFCFDRALASARLTRQDLTLVPIEDKEAAVLIAAGKLDVAFGNSDDFRLSSLWDQVVQGPSYSSFLPEFMYSFVYYGKRFLDDSREEGVRFLRAFLKGQREFQAGKNPAFLTTFAKENGLDRERFLATCRNDMVADGQIRTRDIQTVIDWAVQREFSSARILAEEMIDTRFLDEAKRA
jgi:ABC-type nitrate/sulfonate/bicarbonate transport system substrate-binding protein